MGLGSKIKRSITGKVQELKEDRTKRIQISKQAKSDNYWKSYEEEKRRQATLKGTRDAQKRRGDTLVNTARSVSRQLPKLSNPNDPFYLETGPNRSRKKKKRNNNMNRYLDGLM